MATLSYSSANVLLTCPMAYKHYKVLFTPKDKEEDQLSFRVGKAFHSICELTNHDKKNFSMELFDKVILEQDVREHRYPIFAMITSYFSLHKASGLEVIAVERKFENEYILGFIDAVMIEPSTGFWWVVDLKTAASIMESKFAGLTHDAQLNLYAGIMKEYLAKEMGLDYDKFAGCRYRVTAKSKIVVKDGETLAAYAKRVNVRSLDIAVPVSLMNIEETCQQHQALWAQANRINASTIVLKNRNSCFNFNKPCDYFSQCYGCKPEDTKLVILDQSEMQKVITLKDTDYL